MIVITYSFLLFGMIAIVYLTSLWPGVQLIDASLKPIDPFKVSFQTNNETQEPGTPDNVAIDRKTENVIVLNDDNSAVHRFTNEGEFIKSW